MSSHSKSPKRKKGGRRPGVVRRSFALPARLVEQVSEAAPEECAGNLNAIVRTALEEYVRRKEDEEFEREMERMAADPQIQAVNAELNHAFRHALMDGLPNDPTW